MWVWFVVSLFWLAALTLLTVGLAVRASEHTEELRTIRRHQAKYFK